MKKNESLNMVAQFEQVSGHAKNIAVVLGDYYQDLINAKIPEKLASELVLELNRVLLWGASK